MCSAMIACNLAEFTRRSTERMQANNWSATHRAHLMFNECAMHEACTPLLATPATPGWEWLAPPRYTTTTYGMHQKRSNPATNIGTQRLKLADLDDQICNGGLDVSSLRTIHNLQAQLKTCPPLYRWRSQCEFCLFKLDDTCPFYVNELGQGLTAHNKLGLSVPIAHNKS